MSAQRAPGTAGSGTGDSGTYELYGDTLIRLDGAGGGSTTGDFISLGLNDITSAYGGGSYADADQGGMLTQQQSYGINPGTGQEYSQATFDRYTAWNPATTADGVITPEEWAAYQLSFGANSDRWDSGWAADPNNYQTLKNALATGIQSLSGTQQQQVQAMYDQIYGTAPAEQPNYGYRPGDNKAFTQDNYTRISRDGGDTNNDGSISADEWVTWMLNKGADAGYEQQWADKMAAAAGSGMLSSAVQQQLTDALNPSTGGASGDSTAPTGWWTNLPPNYTQQDVIDAILADPNVDPNASMNDIFQGYLDAVREATAGSGGDYTGSSGWDPSGSGAVIGTPILDDDGNVIMVGSDAADMGPIYEAIFGTGEKGGEMDLDPVMIAGIPIGTLAMRQDLKALHESGELDPAALLEQGLNQDQVDWLLGTQNTPAADESLEDILNDAASDLDGDSDLENGGAFFDPPAPLSPTGEWQWNADSQDYDWVEGTQEATPLDEGSWTDDIRSAAGSITDKIADYILSQKPPSVSVDDWMKTILPNPSISVVQGGPDNTNIWIKLPGPLGDGLIDLEAIKNGEFTLDDAVKGKIDDAVEAVKGIPGAIKEKASTIFEEIKSAGKNIGDIFEQDGNIFAKILDASGEIIDTIEISVGEIAGGWYTPSDAGWLLGDIIEILGEEFKYDSGSTEEPATEEPATEEPATEEPAGGDSGGGDSSTGGDTDSSGGDSTDTSDTSDGSGDGSSVPGGDETDTSDDDAPEEPVGGDTGDSGEQPTDDTSDDNETPDETTDGSTGDVIDDSPNNDDDLSSGGGSGGDGGPVITPDDGSGGGTDDLVGGGSGGSGSGSGGGGGGAGRQGGMFTGGIGVDYSPLQSVIYKVGDPMVELERMISKSLFKDMM
jgi:hypothetical protein